VSTARTADAAPQGHLLVLSPEHVADTTDDWYTPPWLFEAAGLTFDIDVAAPVDPARRTCPAKAYLTPLEDGLTAPWEGLVWMNPPWSRSLPWLERFAVHPGGGLALLPATRSASTQALFSCADAVTFFTGQFSRPNGAIDHNPWLLILAARGDDARQALRRVAASRAVPSWLKV
jgi:hypothetical protein